MQRSASFEPKLLSGVLSYRHAESGTSRRAQVDFWRDSAFAADGTPTAHMLDFPADLDRPGRWDFTLEDFYLEQNVFSNDVSLGVKLFIGIPAFDSQIAVEPLLTVHDSGEFEIAFEPHNLPGDPTPGQFSIFVGPVPLPAAAWLLGGGPSGLLGIGVYPQRWSARRRVGPRAASVRSTWSAARLPRVAASG